MANDGSKISDLLFNLTEALRDRSLRRPAGFHNHHYRDMHLYFQKSIREYVRYGLRSPQIFEKPLSHNHP